MTTNIYRLNSYHYRYMKDIFYNYDTILLSKSLLD